MNVENSQTNLGCIINKKTTKIPKFIEKIQALETLIMCVMCQCTIYISLKVRSKCHPIKS